MGVEGTAADAAIIAAVQAAGYGASHKGAVTRGPPLPVLSAEEAAGGSRYPRFEKAAVVVAGFSDRTDVFFHGPYDVGLAAARPFMTDNHVAMGLIQMLLTIIIMVINQKFFISGFKSLWHRAPNMDTLVALGATAAFGYSTYALFAMTGAQVRGRYGRA